FQALQGGAGMDTVRPFFPRRPPAMGKVLVQVTVTNHRDPTCRKRFSALVDTGSTGLVLPLAWKGERGDLEAVATVDLATLDRRRAGRGPSPAGGPAPIQCGIFYEHQLTRTWQEDSEVRLIHEALAQVELADRLGIDYAWEVEHHFLEEYSHSSAPEVFLAP